MVYSYACMMSISRSLYLGSLNGIINCNGNHYCHASCTSKQQRAQASTLNHRCLSCSVCMVYTDEASAQRAVLLTPEESLTPAAAAIFTQWFYDYAERATETVESVTDEHDDVSADTAAAAATAAVSAIVATGDAADVADASSEPEYYLTRHGIAAFIHSCCK
jgi:hypothetical protein